MSAISNYLENAILNHVLRNTPYTSPGTNVYVGLYTAAPTDAGGGTEVSGGSYARVQVQGTAAWSAPAGAGTDNVNAITFPTATGNWGEILAVGIFDAATAGNLLFWSWVSNTRFVFTAAASSDNFTAPGHTLSNNDRVILKGTNLPTGVSADTVYFVVGASGSVFQLSTTQGGSAINLTTDGAGEVHRLNVRNVQTNDVYRFDAGNLDIVLD